MTIIPMNVAEITAAIYTTLTENVDIEDAQIDRSGEKPHGEDVGGWVGIYRNRVSYEPRALGMGAGYRMQNVDLLLLVQQSDYTSGEECEDRLEALVQKVVGALLSDESLRGTVQTLSNFSVSYLELSKSEGGVFVQTARIDLTALVPVSAT